MVWKLDIPPATGSIFTAGSVGLRCFCLRPSLFDSGHDVRREFVVVLRRNAGFEPRRRAAITARNDLADLDRPADDDGDVVGGVDLDVGAQIGGRQRRGAGGRGPEGPVQGQELQAPPRAAGRRAAA